MVGLERVELPTSKTLPKVRHIPIPVQMYRVNNVICQGNCQVCQCSSPLLMT